MKKNILDVWLDAPDGTPEISVKDLFTEVNGKRLPPVEFDKRVDHGTDRGRCKLLRNMGIETK